MTNIEFRNFNIHYDPRNPLYYPFYTHDHQNCISHDFDINKLDTLFIALKKVRDLVALDHYLQFLLTKSRRPSHHRSLIIRIFDNNCEIFIKAINYDRERAKLEDQKFVFDIYTLFPYIPPPKHLTQRLSSRAN